MYPQRLAAALPLVDWVGLDVKAPFADYARITGVAGSGERAHAGLLEVVASGVAHEARTTVHPALLADTEVVGLAHDLAARGVKHFVIQAFRSQGCADEALRRNATRDRPLQQVGEGLAGLFEDFSVRAM
jgi:pyruvate formate lyase activating enzyme